ncbi:serine/arginine repetitive matrix protein 2-like isoform X2 [Eleginops maclovinus]|uniref:serine/arginine repetitive matrix protein 2-like isoform X2 n=1 Tax=Eleginops maclovinus TaxID=56733 RepID=UPI003080359A
MAPTRMKLRVRLRDNAAAAGGGGEPEEEEEQSRGGRSSRRKTTSTPSSPPPAATSSASLPAPEEASPDSKCPICLDRFNNLAYLDRCLHRFCFPCIQEWSHNKAECPLCKQPFASILHSVRAEDDFKEYTLRPPPASSSVAATVAMVAAMASAARNDHQMRLMLRRQRVADGGEATRRRRRERGGRGGRTAGVWEWYINSRPVQTPEEEEHIRDGAEVSDRGVIFEGLSGLEGTVTAVAPDDRASRRLMSRLVSRRRLQREGGVVRRLRERETVSFRRSLYRSGIRVQGVVAGTITEQPLRDITAGSFRGSPAQLDRLRPWLRRELTVLYGVHTSLVDIVQRIIIARLQRHGLEDTPTIEEELRPFLLARTDHFLHELVSFARSPLVLESYDLQAVYEPPDAAMQLNDDSSDGSVIAISEEEEEEGDDRHEDMQTGSCLSLAAWDDETPGPSYSLSPANQEAAEKDEEEECLIVGYKKPIAERTPELVQLTSDSEDEEEDKKKVEEEDKKKKEEELLAAAAAPLLQSPTISPCTEEAPKEKDGGLWSCSSKDSATPTERDRKSGSEAPRREKRKRRRKRSGTLFNPNRSMFPAMMRRRSSSAESSPPNSDWAASSSSPSSSSSSTFSPVAPSLSPNNHGEKPGGKRKYKSRHLDRDDKDPTWRPREEKERRKRSREEERRKERRREDRSPSVEIIYEGTITSSAANAPARKRRRKRPGRTPHSSSPVIITLDSDSSRGADSSCSSSPISSQQTVDFSDLPPLPLVHSSGVGGALSADIGELPIDILDRDGSDGSEEPIAINSDIDVEKVEAGGSDEEPIGVADSNDVTNSQRKRKSLSDSRLLARILNDLQGINAPTFNPLTFEPHEARGKLFRDGGIEHRDFDAPACRSAIHPLPYYERLKDTEVPPLLKQASPVRPYNRNTPPPLKHKDAGSPCLSPVSPVDLHSNPTNDMPQDNCAIPPISLLKKHFTSAPRGELASASSAIDSHLAKIGIHSMSQTLPVDSHPSPSETGSTSAASLSHLDFNSIPSTKETSSSPIDLHPLNSSSPFEFHTAKTGRPKEKQANAASRNKTLSTDFCHESTVDLHPSSSFPPGGQGGGDAFSGASCDDRSSGFVSSIDAFQPADSHSSRKRETFRVRSAPTTDPIDRLSPIDMHSQSPKHTADLHSSSKSDHFLESLLTSRASSEQSTIPRSSFSPIDLRPSSPKCTIDLQTSSKKENFLESLSTSRDSPMQTAPSGMLSPIDVHPINPKSKADHHSPSKWDKLSERLSGSLLAPATSDRLSPIDLHRKSPKTSGDFHSFSTTSQGLSDNKASLCVNHGDALPHGRLTPVDLHYTSPVPPVNSHVSSSRLNHTALTTATFQTSRKKRSFQSEATVDSHSKPQNHHQRFPTDALSQNNLPVDSHLKHSWTDNQVTSSRHAGESQWNSPTDARSDPATWNTQLE